jgi:hypothetical protein
VEEELERLRAEQSRLQFEFDALRKKPPRDLGEHQASLAHLESHIAKLHEWRKKLRTPQREAGPRHDLSE